MKLHRLIFFISSLFSISSCTFNPFTTNNDLTGSAKSTAIGAGVGAGGAALLHSSKPIIVLAGLSGAAIGYYVSTLRYASGGIIQGGGQVFTVGEYVTIDIPSDFLFDQNTSEFLDHAYPILMSTVDVLNRYPRHNIMVSGNTSGFRAAKYERELSENRARQIASFLWANGIGDYKYANYKTRVLSYVGFGDYFPIANRIHNEGIRQNSHIQITAYPSGAQLGVWNCQTVYRNIGARQPEYTAIRTSVC